MPHPTLQNDPRAIEILIRVPGVPGKVSIITHERPHGDECYAIVLIESFGTPEWVTEHLDQGSILLGLGGGEFDEHATDKVAAKRNECCASLVAKSLGYATDPQVRPTLDYVLLADAQGKDTAFGICAIIRLLHQTMSTVKLLDWARRGFKARMADLNDKGLFDLQYIAHVIMAMEGTDKGIKWLKPGMSANAVRYKQFHTTTRQEFDKAKIELIPGPDDRTLTLVVVESDDDLIAQFARSPLGGNADVTIVRRSNGHTQIFTRPQSALTLYDVAKMLRYEEQYLRGQMVETNWDRLAAAKAYEGDVWRFLVKGQMLLNGSKSASTMEPTKIPFEDIIALVKIGLNPDQFQKDRQAWCRNMRRCAHTSSNPCPWYVWGLTRCLRVRAVKH